MGLSGSYLTSGMCLVRLEALTRGRTFPTCCQYNQFNPYTCMKVPNPCVSARRQDAPQESVLDSLEASPLRVRSYCPHKSTVSQDRS